MITPNLIPGWGINEAEDAERWRKREEELARLIALPEYQKHQEDNRWLSNLLSQLLYVDAHEFAAPAPPVLSQVAYRMARIELRSPKPLTYDADGYETQEYKYFKQQRGAFHAALRRYVGYFRTGEWDDRTYKRVEAEEHLGRR